MTKQHFQRIADELKWIKPSRVNFKRATDYTAAHAKWCEAVQAMAKVGRAFNPRFQWSKFEAACGYED